jgi:hypothetical protein
MPKSMQSGCQVRHSHVCQACERIGDNGQAPVLPIPDVQVRVHNLMLSSEGPAVGSRWRTRGGVNSPF